MALDTLGVTEPSSWQSSFRPYPRPLPGSAGEKLCFAGGGSLIQCKTIHLNHHGSSGKIVTCLPRKLALKWELFPDTSWKRKKMEATSLVMPTQWVCFGAEDWSFWLVTGVPVASVTVLGETSWCEDSSGRRQMMAVLGPCSQDTSFQGRSLKILVLT